MSNGARLRERLADKQPAGARLNRHVDLLAGEAANPAADRFTRRRDPPTAQLARLGVERIKRDLVSVHVESGYDRHQGPPFELPL